MSPNGSWAANVNSYKLLTTYRTVVNNLSLVRDVHRATNPIHMAPVPNYPTKVPTVLYLDDEEENRVMFKAAFRKDFNVLLAADLNAAWQLLEADEVHVVICDQRMPGVTGSEALRRIREHYPHVHRMLITAHADLQALVDALNEGGVCHYIQKPWEVEEVRKAVAKAWAQCRTDMEQRAYTAMLLESNRQLESALRQSLLS